MSREDPARELRDELKAVNERLQRYYDAFEAGSLDAEDLGVRVKTLKGKRVELEERLRAYVAMPELPASYTTPENLARIRMAIHAAFWNGSAQLKKQWLSFLVKDLVLDGKSLVVTGNVEGIMGCLDGCQDNAEPDVARVIRSIQKWRPNCEANANYTLHFFMDCKSLRTGELRFERMQVLSWMDELVAMGKVEKWSTIGEELGVGERLLVEFLKAA